MVAKFPQNVESALITYGYVGNMDFSTLPDGFDQQEDIDTLIRLLLILSYIQPGHEVNAYSFNRDSAHSFKLYQYYVPKLTSKIFEVWIDDWTRAKATAYSVETLLRYVCTEVVPIDLIWLERETLLVDAIYLMNLVLCLDECESDQEDKFYKFLGNSKVRVGGRLLKLLKYFPLAFYNITKNEAVNLDTDTLLKLIKLCKGNGYIKYVDIIAAWMNQDELTLGDYQEHYSDPPLLEDGKLDIKQIMTKLNVPSRLTTTCYECISSGYKTRTSYKSFTPDKYDYTHVRKGIKRLLQRLENR